MAPWQYCLAAPELGSLNWIQVHLGHAIESWCQDMAYVFKHNSKEGIPAVKKFPSEFTCLCSLGYQHSWKAKASRAGEMWTLWQQWTQLRFLGPHSASLQVQEDLCWCWGWHILLSRLLTPQCSAWSLWCFSLTPVQGYGTFLWGSEGFQSPDSWKTSFSVTCKSCRSLGPSQEQPGPGGCSASALKKVCWISDLSEKTLNFDTLSFSV